MAKRPSHAIVRPPSAQLARCELTHLARTPVDSEQASAQHAGYVQLLQTLGVELVWAPALPECPDGVFVEDTLVVIDGLAIVTRPGAASRRPETASIEALLAPLGLGVRHLEAPATLDGGDVLVTERHVFVGASTRTNLEGIEQLVELARLLGRTVVPVKVEQALHLKSVLTALPDRTLIACTGQLDVQGIADLGYEVRSAPEPHGGNVLCVGDVVVVSSEAPATVQMLGALGFETRSLDIGEFHKLEAGLTCLSVLVFD
jgi:dimethylargininase